MDTETLNAIKLLFEECSNKNTATLTATYLTVGGMLGVAILGALSQWFITKRVVDEEHRRLNLQLNSEFQAKRHEKWESDILESITELLRATDPEINSNIDPAVVTKYVLRVQLLLNVDNPTQGEVNNLVTHLALAVNGWQGDKDELPILKIHGQLLDAAKKLVYQPK